MLLLLVVAAVIGYILVDHDAGLYRDMTVVKITDISTKHTETQTGVLSDKENYYVIKDISKIEYTNYLKVKNDKLPFLKPLKIAKHENHTYFLYNYYENHQSIYEAYDGILKTISLLHKKTAKKVPQPKMAEIKYKKIALIANDRFNMLEMKISCLLYTSDAADE